MKLLNQFECLFPDFTSSNCQLVKTLNNIDWFDYVFLYLVLPHRIFLFISSGDIRSKNHWRCFMGKMNIQVTYFFCFIFITAQKMNFFSKCAQMCRKLRIWSHLLKKSLKENFICKVLLLKFRTSFPQWNKINPLRVNVLITWKPE